MYKTYLLLNNCLLYILVIISCTADLRKQEYLLIDVEKNINNFSFAKLSEFSDDIDYIPLETNDSTLLKSISHLIITDSMLIISDYYYCITFDVNGEYICSYGSKGHGPGQFELSINNISFDNYSGKIYLSCKPDKLIEFALNGTFLREISIPDQFSKGASEFYVAGSNIFCGLDRLSDVHRLILFTDTGQILGVYPNYFNDNTLKGNLPAYALFNGVLFLIINDKILYKDGLCDTAFYLNKNNLQREPVYCFNFGKYRKVFDYLKSLSGFSLSNEEMRQHMSVADFMEVGDFLFFTCNFGAYLPIKESIMPDKSKIPPGNEIFPISAVRSIFNKKT